MNRFTVLYFGDVWDAEWRRRQQLAFQLASMEEVEALIFVEQPLPLTAFAKYALRLSSPAAAARVGGLVSQRSLVTCVSDKVHMIAPVVLVSISGLRCTMGGELALYYHLTSFMIRRLLDKIQPSMLVLWISYPPFLPSAFVHTFDQTLTWYDCTEDWSTIPELGSTMAARAAEVDRYLTVHADVVSVVSRIHWETKRQKKPDALWIPNGVDLAAFDGASQSPTPKDMSDIPHPRLVLVGNANISQHWEFIEHVLNQRRQWSLVIIGPESLPPSLKSRLITLPNLHFLGRKPYSEIPAYLAHADVCVQCYRPERAPSFESTTKTFLYLASGRPFVSYSLVDEIDAEYPIEIARSELEFIERIEHVLVNDTVELQMRRRGLAEVNTWGVRGEQIRVILRKKLEVLHDHNGSA